MTKILDKLLGLFESRVEHLARLAKLVVRRIGWVDSATAKVDFASYTGPLFGHGFLGSFHKGDAGWALKHVFSEWKS